MRRRIRVLGVVVAAGIGAGGLSACDPKSASTFEDDASVSGKIRAVRLDSGSGGVTLRGGKGAGKVSVHRSVEYKGDRPEKATHRVEGGVLVLGGCGEDCAVNYTVELPAGLPVSGQTANGPVSLSDVGAVNVTTSSGTVALDGVAGAVDVRTTNGRITGRRLRGGSVAARTTNGPIELTPAVALDIRAKTSNGTIALTVPTGPYQVSAHVSNGHKYIDVPDDPHGAHRLDLTTSNGTVTVKTAKTVKTAGP
ncbi:DUF4097 family beta strand repeat-containing protein [Streptomyces sp. NPDC050617]|uniref:DUF4097 family beta strand repeat-containing protein n=1 Tax=Streptomyces sp. NPDC050617 TaxID=3154628 RepID=UPI00342FEE86